MARCYLLAVCSASSLDQASNNFSLFNLVERVQVVPPTDGEPTATLEVPFETHIYLELEPGEMGADLAIRALITEVGADTPRWKSEWQPVKSGGHRVRIRLLGLIIPQASWRGRVEAELRDPSGEASRIPIAWPLEVELGEPAAARPLPDPPSGPS